MSEIEIDTTPPVPGADTGPQDDEATQELPEGEVAVAEPNVKDDEEGED